MHVFWGLLKGLKTPLISLLGPTITLSFSKCLQMVTMRNWSAKKYVMIHALIFLP